MLTGIQVAIAPAGDPDAVLSARLRAAGATVGIGPAAITVTDPTHPPAAPVRIVATAAALPTALAVDATDLALADAALAALAGGARSGVWPAQVRLAAPPAPAIGVAAGVPDGLTAALARAATATHSFADPGTVPDGLDAVVTTSAGPVADGHCAVTVSVDGRPVTALARAFDDAVALDIAALLTTGRRADAAWPIPASGAVELVVFGAHLRGGPLVHQLTDLGARWMGEISTAARYRMTVLPTVPPKPAVTRVPDGTAGAALYGHRWAMSAAALGRFLTALPAPMQLGKVEFADGSWRTAFGADAAAATGADISSFGSWPAAITAGAVDGAGQP
ncbi:allophanate hydrolase-related protein [Mycolicibacterium sp.]|uniref:allophanate hydrolase-related protein n=1 Tax=Mycolicibacterium sp. TaxID=2320850 RepID=UPI003D12AE96